MLRLAFLSRVAFIANVCLVLSLLLRYIPFAQPHQSGVLGEAWQIWLSIIIGTILQVGLALSLFMNPAVNLWYAVVLVQRRPLRNLMPVWLAMVNFIFLLLQLYLLFR